ncbi:MAG: hypothetical protein PF961_21470 [Planctomycetota bacterium]|jgi:23S rRNA (adenine-N6)-dimethyltransferase|nr:hypothetical protein [Planctomycetota bacterium]
MARADLHQHDLTPAAAEALVAGAGVKPTEHVLDLGAGTGAITAACLAAGAKVSAIEIDPQRATGLRQRFATELADGSLVLQVGDARHHLPLLPARWRMVANPPFMHTAVLLRRFLIEDLPVARPHRIDLVLQRQAAGKLVGSRGGYTRSSVMCHLAGKPARGEDLARNAVTPPSHVPLCTFSWQARRSAPEANEIARVDRLLERAFAGPKDVRSALRGVATPAILKRQGAEQGWNPDAHPRFVPPLAWLTLSRFLAQIGKLT